MNHAVSTAKNFRNFIQARGSKHKQLPSMLADVNILKILMYYTILAVSVKEGMSFTEIPMLLDTKDKDQMFLHPIHKN
jgi:hypothetical protein